MEPARRCRRRSRRTRRPSRNGRLDQRSVSPLRRARFRGHPPRCAPRPSQLSVHPDELARPIWARAASGPRYTTFGSAPSRTPRPDPRPRQRARRAPASRPRVLQESTQGVVPVVHQLRVYEIFDHNKAAFHARFRDHAMRIMKRHGFAFLGMWESQIDDQTEFVYLLEWPDVATKEAAWRAFMADEEWKEIKRLTNAQHGDLGGEIEDRLLGKTAYSPATATPGRGGWGSSI